MSAATSAIDTTLAQALQAVFGGADCVVLPSASAAVPGSAASVAVVGNEPELHLNARLRLKGFGHFRRFAALPSAKGSRWLFPLGNHSCTESASRFYTPYNLRARFSKAMFLTFFRMGSRLWDRDQAVVASREIPALETLLAGITGERHPVFALGLGRPGRYRHLTLQVMRASGRILGYVKIPLTAEGTQRVRHEADLLKKLEQNDALRPHLPRVLVAGRWQDRYMLFQTPLAGEPGPARFTDSHRSFLAALAGVHRVEMPGQSLVKQVARRWETCASRFDSNWQALSECALRAAREALDGKTVACGVSHGDFVPWNTRLHRDRLSVFDWESASWEAPLCWDAFHFDIEVAHRLGKKTRDEALAYAHPVDRACFLLYLLNSICQEFEGEPEKFDRIEFRQRLLMERLSPRNGA